MADMSTIAASNRYSVARIWRGRVRTERADEYASYLAEAGLKVLAGTAVGVEQFREDRGEFVEFVTISYWESVEAMTRYTHGDPTAINHLARDAEFLVELPDRVQVLQLTFRHWSDAGDGPTPARPDDVSRSVPTGIPPQSIA